LPLTSTYHFPFVQREDEFGEEAEALAFPLILILLELVCHPNRQVQLAATSHLLCFAQVIIRINLFPYLHELALARVFIRCANFELEKKLLPCNLPTLSLVKEYLAIFSVSSPSSGSAPAALFGPSNPSRRYRELMRIVSHLSRRAQPRLLIASDLLRSVLAYSPPKDFFPAFVAHCTASIITEKRALLGHLADLDLVSALVAAWGTSSRTFEERAAVTETLQLLMRFDDKAAQMIRATSMSAALRHSLAKRPERIGTLVRKKRRGLRNWVGGHSFRY
jgi:hypothetical protein